MSDRMQELIDENKRLLREVEVLRQKLELMKRPSEPKIDPNKKGVIYSLPNNPTDSPVYSPESEEQS